MQVLLTTQDLMEDQGEVKLKLEQQEVVTLPVQLHHKEILEEVAVEHQSVQVQVEAELVVQVVILPLYQVILLVK